MLHAHNGFLKLAVDHNAVSDDDDIIKNNFVICIVQRSEAVRQPCDRVRFAGACAVLDQIVLRRAILLHIRQQLADHVKLVIPGKDNIFGLLRLSGQLILAFLGFDEDELADEVKDGVLFQNVLPHIGDTVLVFEGGVARTGIDAFTVAHVEGQEEGRVPGKLGGHIDLFQIHRKVHKAPGLEAEQSGVRITVNPVLINGVLVRLAGGIALQFKGHNCDTVQEDDQVSTLIIACPDLLHNGENILLILCQQFPVKSGGRLGVHKLQLHIGDFNAVLQHIQQAAARFCDLRVDETDEGILQIGFVDFAERLHFLRLGIVQKLKQQLPIHSKETVVAGRFADDVTVVLREPVHDEMLIFFFGENTCHFFRSSLCRFCMAATAFGLKCAWRIKWYPSSSA